MSTDNIIDTMMPSPEQVDTIETVEAEVAAPAVEPETEPVEGEEPKVVDKDTELEKLRKAHSRQANRIGKKTAEVQHERQLRQQLEQELQQYRSKQNSPEPETDEVSQYVDSRAEAKARAIFQEELNRREQAQTASQSQANFMQRVNEAKAELPDIDQVFAENAHVELPPYLMKAIQKLPDGAKLAYHIFKEDMIDDLSDMDEVEGLLEIANICQTMSVKKVVAPVSKAPAPTSQSRGNGVKSNSLDNQDWSQLKSWLRS